LKWADRGEKPKPKKYVFVERSYEPDSEDEKDEDEDSAKAGAAAERNDRPPPECTLEPAVKSLMELIFNQQYFEATMASLNYDSAKLPLGKLSKATITRGYQALKELSNLLDDPTLATTEYNTSVPEATEQLSNSYYSTIPHAFGRNRPPVISTNEQLKKEIELMESLTDLKDADLIMKKDRKNDEEIHQLDSRFKALGMQEMTPLEPSTEEFASISDYLLKTCGSTHYVNYEVMDIFRIQRDGEEERFQSSPFSKVDSDRRLLW
jgi:poly [ADP-ribose] polymerase